jgi:hypothetical protein
MMLTRGARCWVTWGTLVASVSALEYRAAAASEGEERGGGGGGSLWDGGAKQCGHCSEVVVGDAIAVA